MKERPIIFSTEMVKATIDGRKSQTRRIVKPRLVPFIEQSNLVNGKVCLETLDCEIPCPYGQVGDKLWVRETWAIADLPLDQEFGDIITTSLVGFGLEYLKACEMIYKADDADNESRWKPSIHMPRWASRITLEITEVRVEKLQEITGKDAIAEGINWPPSPRIYNRVLSGKEHIDTYNYERPTANFQRLWDSINAKRGYSFKSNPWVWVISFKRLK